MNDYTVPPKTEIVHKGIVYRAGDKMPSSYKAPEAQPKAEKKKNSKNQKKSPADK
jgi:hypothetical protein